MLWVVTITSADNRAWPGDLTRGKLNEEAGLKSPSVIRPCKLATIEAVHAERLGRIRPASMSKLMSALRRSLALA